MAFGKKKPTVIEVEKHVACLPGYENKNIGEVYKKLTRVFYHKSGSELRLEHEQKTKLITFKP